MYIILSIILGACLGGYAYALYTTTPEIQGPPEAPPAITPIRVTTTGYCPGPPCVTRRGIVDRRTATNRPVRHGICAADINVFPFGTVFMVPYYGICEVQDTGSQVQGLHLDLYFEDVKDALAWGRREMVVWQVRRP